MSRLNTSGKVAWTRTYYPGVDTRGGAITLGKNGDLLVAGGVLGKLAPDDQAYGMDFLALRLCQDGAIKGVQRRDLGSDEWTRSMQEATSGDVWYAGYTFRRKTAGAAQDSQDVYLLNIRPE